MNRVLSLVLAALLAFSMPVFADENDTVKIESFAAVGDAVAIQNVKPVKNIIIMIGDGMGFNALGAARAAAFGRGTGLALDRMQAMGQSLTWSLSDDYITDSAAGGTALSSGVRTLNGRIAEDKDARPVRTILELAKSLGKSTGVIATCTLTDATPASFLSHAKNRSNEWEIARQISGAPVDVLLGGGRAYFLPAADRESLRDDDLNLLEAMRKRGMTVVTAADEFRALDLSKVKSLAGLFALEDMKTAPQREMPLPEMVEGALKVLSRNPKGFFLMVEGSQIDWAGHGNNLKYSVDEILDFDSAVAKAVEFAGKDGSTLVIVTADHETGGLAINKAIESDRTITAGWTHGSHTGSAVPLLAFGPNAQAFAGLHHNFHIPQMAVQGWGVKNFATFAYDK